MSSIVDSLQYMAGEALLYLIFGTLATVFLTAVAVLPLLLGIPVLGVKRGLRLVKRVALFALAVHLAGFAGCLVFVGLFANRLYFARDQIVDWLPYLPSMNWIRCAVVTLLPARHPRCSTPPGLPSRYLSGGWP